VLVDGKCLTNILVLQKWDRSLELPWKNSQTSFSFINLPPHNQRSKTVCFENSYIIWHRNGKENCFKISIIFWSFSRVRSHVFSIVCQKEKPFNISPFSIVHLI
jgi:hypothetical protein